jgi:ectoine hydroxylase-related dioxygenase (phytanoyl-CoA dioxygenase family)
MLTEREIEKWWSKGFVGPMAACSADEMAILKQYLLKNIIHGGVPPYLKNDPFYCRHLDDPIVAQLCSNQHIVNCLSSLAGDDLIMYMSEFINKQPGAREIKWHQDIGNILDPIISLTVWIAIDAATIDNGCLQIIPSGSATHIPHAFGEQGTFIDFSNLDHTTAEYVEMRSGEFIVFKDTTIHASGKNTTSNDRMAFTFRVTVPIVKIKKDARAFPGFRLTLLKGYDKLGFNSNNF